MGYFTTNVNDLLGRPHILQLGDPTQAAGAGMVSLGVPPRVEIVTEHFVQMSKNELGQIVGAGWEAFIGGQLNVTLKGRTAAFLAVMFKGIIAGSNSLGYSTDLLARDQITGNLMPIDATDVTDPTEANCRWLTNLVFSNLGAWVAKLENTQESDNYTVSAMIGVAAADQAGQPINMNYRGIFKGSWIDALGANPTDPWTLADPAA